MNSKNEVFEYLIDQLRQQVNNNQCEDLAHEVQSLKNQLRDASAQIKELHKALATATGDVGVYKLIRKGGYIDGGQRYVAVEHGPEQSGFRKEDTQVTEPWIKWGGGERPVDRSQQVDVIFRDGGSAGHSAPAISDGNTLATWMTSFATVSLSRGANTNGTFTIKALR